jgi:hypothetical protein
MSRLLRLLQGRAAALELQGACSTSGSGAAGAGRGPAGAWGRGSSGTVSGGAGGAATGALRRPRGGAAVARCALRCAAPARRARAPRPPPPRRAASPLHPCERASPFFLLRPPGVAGRAPAQPLPVGQQRQQRRRRWQQQQRRGLGLWWRSRGARAPASAATLQQQ